MSERNLTPVWDAMRKVRLVGELGDFVSDAAKDRVNAELQLALREAFPDRFYYPRLPKNEELICLAEYAIEQYGSTPMPGATRVR